MLIFIKRCKLDSSYQFELDLVNLTVYRTSPTMNILLYNAGGNGDNLYGIEPASYYIKNLILNLGLSFLIFLLYPLIFVFKLFKLMTSQKHNLNDYIIKLTVPASVYLWLGLLFSRPHKVITLRMNSFIYFHFIFIQEERFMYPVYPLICLMSAEVVDAIFHYIESLTVQNSDSSTQNKLDTELENKIDVSNYI